MAKTKREQLKKIVNKEYTDILEEVKRNEAYFNRIAYDHVINILIKENILGNLHNPETVDYNTMGQAPVEDAPLPQSSAGLPQHIMPKLIDVAQGAPVGIRDNIPKIGEEVFTQLEKEIGHTLTQEQTGNLVIDIIKTVVGMLTTSRNWEAGANINPPKR
jgi:hypothetical protein